MFRCLCTVVTVAYFESSLIEHKLTTLQDVRSLEFLGLSTFPHTLSPYHGIYFNGVKPVAMITKLCLGMTNLFVSNFYFFVISGVEGPVKRLSR